MLQILIAMAKRIRPVSTGCMHIDVTAPRGIYSVIFSPPADRQRLAFEGTPMLLAFSRGLVRGRDPLRFSASAVTTPCAQKKAHDRGRGQKPLWGGERKTAIDYRAGRDTPRRLLQLFTGSTTLFTTCSGLSNPVRARRGDEDSTPVRQGAPTRPWRCCQVRPCASGLRQPTCWRGRFGFILVARYLMRARASRTRPPTLCAPL
jgi:hypothetical protein